MKYAAYIALGTNLGNKEENLKKAVELLERNKIQTILKSPVYKTKPYGDVKQDDFFNAVIGVLTELPPLLLLEKLKTFECEMGREKTERWGPRIIDFDIILFGESVVNNDKLTIPHKDFRNRDFVLRPLKDIGKMMIDPVTGKTVEELYAQLNKDTCVKTEIKL